LLQGALILLLSLLSCGGTQGGQSTESRRYEVLVARGRVLARTGDLAAAASTFEDATYARPEGVEARFYLAKAHLERGQLYRALDEAERAAELGPDHGPSHVLVAEILNRLGRSGEAERILLGALARWPTLARVHRVLGELRLGEGNLGEAELRLGRALELDGALPGTQELLGRVLFRLGRPEDAARLFEAAIGQADCSDLAYGGLGAANLLARRFRAARAAFRQAVECAEGSSQNPEPWHLAIALSLASDGSTDEAIASLDRAGSFLDAPDEAALRWRVAQGPEGWGCRAEGTACTDSDERFWAAALSQLVLGAPDVTLRVVDEALAAYDGDAMAHWIAAEALLELGRDQEAAIALDRAGAWEPSEAVRAVMESAREELSDSGEGSQSP